ncbi:hypothetical protein [Halobacterium zhouii]|uniref:hypothetical protein n=1 Tax=Halobacterium zhouii TaxID=2902624 RepID=UPI001E5D01CB|nr:hypothetical protein [Halobacterium zhouii]
MSAVATALTVGTWLFLLATGFWAVSSVRVRRGASRPTGGVWVRGVGAVAVVGGTTATGLFFVRPPLAVYALTLAGVLAYVAGVLDASRAAATALDAAGPTAPATRRLRAFWCAAGVYYRGTRLCLALSLGVFLLAALTAALSVTELVSAVGAVAQGGVMACVVCLATVGVFVPTPRDEAVTEAVAEAVRRSRS